MDAWTAQHLREDVAASLGRDMAQIRDIIGQDSETARLLLVCLMVYHLRHSLTAASVLDWFRRPHPKLWNATPVSLLPDERYHDTLLYVVTDMRELKYLAL